MLIVIGLGPTLIQCNHILTHYAYDLFPNKVTLWDSAFLRDTIQPTIVSIPIGQTNHFKQFQEKPSSYLLLNKIYICIYMFMNKAE